ncbi:MAG TPA: hypothetical protein VFD67_03825 [Gemmatimonadaceae bacterium]|nr:hypothetical protein [Gemmatimonadaceae bacterium]
MPSHRTMFRAGPLVVESRPTTRDLRGSDADDADESASDCADDDGMALLKPPSADGSADPADALLDELHQLSTRGGERDSESLARFQHNVAALRALPGVTGPFRAKVASASGWAALLFSSWRHLKYNQPNVSGADRVRAFIRGDLVDARRMHRVGSPQ